MKPDPLGIERDELVVYLLVLCVISGVATLFQLGGSNAVNTEAPDAVRIFWGTMLIFGAGSTLAGMFWQWDARDGLLMKRAGMLTLGIASLLFGLVVIAAVGTGGLFSGGIVIGFAYACLRRYMRINRRIKQIIRTSQAKRT